MNSERLLDGAESVGNGVVPDDSIRSQPNEQFAGHAVAPAKRFGKIVPHMALCQTRCPGVQLVQVGILSQLGDALLDALNRFIRDITYHA